MSETPIDAFLSDETFLRMVDARQQMIAVQKLGKEPISLPAVTTEIGAKIVAFYELGTPMEISEPGRFVGKHDMLGGILYYPHDPLLQNREIVLAGFRLVRDMQEIRWRLSRSLSLFLAEELFDDNQFTLDMLAADAKTWITLPKDRQQRPDIMLAAIRAEPIMFQMIAGKYPHAITPEIAREAVTRDTSNIHEVPAVLRTDELRMLAQK